MKEICNFSEHDSVWSLLLAFGHYEILYEEIPAKIAEQAHRLIAEHKIALEHTAEAADRHVKANLVESVAKAAREMAQEVIASSKQITIADSRNKFILGLTVSIGVAAMAMCLLAWSAFAIGSRSSAAQVAWAVSPEGVAARHMAELNDVRSLIQCSAGQKRVEGNKTFCVPYDDREKKITGWRIQ
ncbi:DUF6753 family protein [Undibacterium arcticum]|uniref:DUF6753 family protein n=1 Tax=Undibacterium arcticum TaxID=1762892 RepID=UPI0036082B7C